MAAGGLAALAIGAATAPAAARPAPVRRAVIAGTRPAWATAARQVHGTAATAAVTRGTLTLNVYLASRNPAGLTAFASAVSTPGSRLYGHYLSAHQAMAQFGPDAAEVRAVERWLAAAGLSVTKASAQIGGYVQARGGAAAAAKAFDVTFGAFRGPDGTTVRAPLQAASVPPSVAGDVLSVSGLDSASHFAKPYGTLPVAGDVLSVSGIDPASRFAKPYGTLPPPGQNYWAAPPCSHYYAEDTAWGVPPAYGQHQPYTNCGYTPRQIRGAYGVTSSAMTGKGQTVAILDAYASPTMPRDANQYAKVTSDPEFASGQYKQYLAGGWNDAAAGACNAPAWYEEETLDVEAVHGMAPAADVTYVGAASCTDGDLLSALALIVDDHLASIVTDSWGEPFDTATLVPVYDLVFQAGAAEGIGFFFSSGDNGYESPGEDPGSDQVQVNFPASSPYVTSVGGTSLAIGATDNYEFETSWGTLLDPLSSGGSWEFTPPGEYPQYYNGSGGGGVSTAFAQPSYQKKAVPHALATHQPNGTTSTAAMRVVPDVSALADPSTGFLVGETLYQPNGTTLAFSLSRYGGTSVASPTWAGIEADAQQAAGHPLGFANPLIYQMYGTQAFHDVTDHPSGPGYLAEVRINYTDPRTRTGPLITYLRTLGIDGEGAAALPAVSGYDDATGVGSPERYIELLKRH